MAATVLTFRPAAFAGDFDLEAIAQLLNTCRVTDGLESRTSVAKLRENFANPQFDMAHDLRLWWDSARNLVAAASLWRMPPKDKVMGQLEFEIHPQVRHSGLAADVIAWGEQRLRAVGQNFTLPLVLHAGCRDSVSERRSLLSQFGFTPERYFFRLQRSLATPLPTSQIPTGWQIRSVDPQQDAAAWVEMFNDTFIDHWNYHPIKIETFHHHRTLANYNPELDLVVETPKGQLVTFCASIIDSERNARLGCQEGHVCLLGTRRGYRRLGLARSLLLASLHKLKAAGIATATIGVDAQNPLGALSFYESVGFIKDRSSTVFRKALTAS